MKITSKPPPHTSHIVIDVVVKICPHEHKIGSIATQSVGRYIERKAKFGDLSKDFCSIQKNVVYLRSQFQRRERIRHQECCHMRNV